MTKPSDDHDDDTKDPFDFSGETPEKSVPSLQAGKAYDSRPLEDTARRTIAYLLISLLWLLVAGMLIMISFGSIKITEMKEFAVVLGPIVTLVSAATGFYYGTKSSSASTLPNK